MDNETQKIFEEQVGKLPNEVVTFLSSSNWKTNIAEIGALYNLPEKELSDFKREVIFVLMGLVHPDALSETLSQEVGLRGAVLEALVANVENKIFAPIRPALLEFFESEASEPEGSLRQGRESADSTSKVESEIQKQEAIVSPIPQKEWGRMPDVAPDNLPTGEEAEPLIPPIPQKVSLSETPPNWDITPTHPFEEKMKKVFTAGQQSVGDFTLEPARQNFPQENLGGPVAPQALTPTPVTPEPAASNISHDPYREPVE